MVVVSQLHLVSVSGVQVVVIVVTLWLVVLWLLLLFFLVRLSQKGGLFLILLFVLSLIAVGGFLGSPSLYCVPPFGLPLGCLLLIRAGCLSLFRS